MSPSQHKPSVPLAAPGGSRATKRTPANAGRARRRSASQEATLGARNREGPSADPLDHIYQWFPRATVTTEGTVARTPGAPSSSTDPPPGSRLSAVNSPSGTEGTKTRAPGAPGSSTDPPLGIRRPRAEVPLVVDLSRGSAPPQGADVARRATQGSGHGSQDDHGSVGSPNTQGTARSRPQRVKQRAGTLPSARSRFLLCPDPGRGANRCLPHRARGARGSWSLTRPPVVRGAANPWTVVTLKRGPSLSLSLSLVARGVRKRGVAQRNLGHTARPHGPQ